MTTLSLRLLAFVAALGCFGFAFYACLSMGDNGIFCAAPLMMAGGLVFGLAMSRGRE